MNPAKRARRFPIFVTLALVAPAGCTPQGRLAIDQPRLGGSERHLDLETVTVQFDTSPGGIERYCLAFPFPGARSGRQYLLYFRVPATTGRHDIGAPLSDGTVVGGFFIQVTGRNKGLTEIASGTIETQDVTAAPTKRRGHLQLTCADESTLAGDFLAERDALVLRDFEQYERAGDVQALLKPSESTRHATAPR